MRSRFKVKGHRSRSPGRLMLRPEVRHIFRTGRPTKYTDGARRPASATSAVTSKVKGQGRKVTWRVWYVKADKISRPISRERNVLQTPKLVERLHTPRAIMRSSFKAKDEVRRMYRRSAFTRPATAETETVSYLLNEKTYELLNWYATEACAVNCHAQLIKLWSWVLARGRGYTVSAALGGHAACKVYSVLSFD